MFVLMYSRLLPKIGYSATAKTWYLFPPQSLLLAIAWWIMSQSCTSTPRKVSLSSQAVSVSAH